jgi:hypothetical protein
MASRREILAALAGIWAARMPGANAAKKLQPDVKVVENSRIGKAPPPARPGNGQVRPALDGKGNVVDSWWASLPLNEWLELMGTDPKSNITPLLPSGFRDFGVIGLAGVFHAWCGAALDRATGRMFFNGGGHNDSSNNGLYELALERMSWRVAMSPSIYTQADVDHSKASWNAYAVETKTPSQGWGGWTQGYEAPNYVWKDGKPTAVHTYAGLEWSPDIRKVLRIGKGHIWKLDPAGSVEKGAAAPWAHDNSCVYDQVTSKLYCFYIDEYQYWRFRKYDPVTDMLSPSTATANKTQLTQGISPVIVGRKIFCFVGAHQHTALPNAYTIDLDSGVFADVLLLNHPPRVQNGTTWKTHTFNCCGDYSPKTGKVYLPHRPGGSGTWGSFTTVDPATGQCGTYTPAGTPPPSGPVGMPSPYSKFRIYQRANGAFMVLIHMYDANLRIVRIA